MTKEEFIYLYNANASLCAYKIQVENSRDIIAQNVVEVNTYYITTQVIFRFDNNDIYSILIRRRNGVDIKKDDDSFSQFLGCENFITGVSIFFEVSDEK